MALLDLDPAHDVRLSVLVPASLVSPPVFANPHAYLAMNLQLLQAGHRVEFITTVAGWLTQG